MGTDGETPPPTVAGREDGVIVQLLEAELGAEIASQQARDAAMQQRATILIGAASIVGALQTGSAGGAPLWSLGLALLAAVAGVVVIFPRTGDALNLRTARDRTKTMPPHTWREKLMDVKLEILDADERWLTIRGRIARAGFIALTASILTATLAMVAQSASTPDPHPSPTLSQSVD